ncbi:tripartite tricarboxylate transporter substrate binding protein [Pseudorhodoplanes sp.]|jgi:tripartite-type tricarboxylate transporter receptor subunit TctC|uniref:Bug family tripartite tricarboxylate transporter substrate binding protein n=1 Tax=Pseudorhodoplanes sp. TaxID=1934341 RepID=UPI002BB4E662|nr:tripartite tricarboxylate transporter substrate binding protein [Pseudorhodoplanes sp.]HWV40776.1 tripartite tricarboxylate transporter substrate binding protein [Pseudorhodoplanes sp.]
MVLKRTWLAIAALILPCVANAQSFPTRPIEMIIPFSAGSALDSNGRIFANAFSEALGQSVVILNRDGASGTLGFTALTRAAPDGYTIGYGPTTPIANAPFLLKSVGYNVESFTYICQLFETVFLIAVGPNSKFTSVSDLFKAAKEKPGELTFGSAGVGTIGHLSLAHMASSLGLKFQHVPYRGDAALVPALLKGDLDFAVVTVGTLVNQPKLKTLAVVANERHPAFPDVPTAQEVGSVKIAIPPAHIGVFAPRNIPAPVRATLEKACETALKSEAVQRAAKITGQNIKYLDGAKFEQQTIADYNLKKEVIHNLGLAAQ